MPFPGAVNTNGMRTERKIIIMAQLKMFTRRLKSQGHVVTINKK
jgi:hypothetical protein